MSSFYLIAPSSYCYSQSAALKGVSRLEQAGHQVDNQQVIARRAQRFAGTDAERLADINTLAQLSGKNRIVLAVRGGYGASRLLANIDWSALAHRQQNDPLLICGHSDFTALQLGLLATGNVITFSGPMLAGDFGADTLNEFTLESFWRALRNKTFDIEWLSDGTECNVEGTLWGGNLSMLVTLIGTPWMPDISNGILVVEDINEEPFRVERMMLQLLHAGILQRQKAIVFGSFSGATSSDSDYNQATMVDYLRSRLSIPLITGLPFGHDPRTVTLPIGAKATLSSSGSHYRLTISDHPVLNE